MLLNEPWQGVYRRVYADKCVRCLGSGRECVNTLPNGYACDACRRGRVGCMRDGHGVRGECLSSKSERRF